jgi:hypothetical protein
LLTQSLKPATISILFSNATGIGYGIEVKNTLGYLDIAEFLAKIKLARHIGVKPVCERPTPANGSGSSGKIPDRMVGTSRS